MNGINELGDFVETFEVGYWGVWVTVAALTPPMMWPLSVAGWLYGKRPE
jgi:hypothetical protein